MGAESSKAVEGGDACKRAEADFLPAGRSGCLHIGAHRRDFVRILDHRSSTVTSGKFLLTLSRMDYAKLKGMDSASDLARNGKFIFAIKLLERLNPEITREEAKAAVDSLGYGKAKPPRQPR
jgi:hypothetical protein